jgi:hypothetical protein
LTRTICWNCCSVRADSLKPGGAGATTHRTGVPLAMPRGVDADDVEPGEKFGGEDDVGSHGDLCAASAAGHPDC